MTLKALEDSRLAKDTQSTANGLLTSQSAAPNDLEKTP
jgi:hypothetical protein